MARVGLFGGTFNPIHIGHLKIAEAAMRAAGLDRVVFIPSGDPYQKARSELAGRFDRLEMTRLAIRGIPRFEVSDVEVRREGPSYTCDTVEAFARAYPADDLYLILGADSLLGIGSWREPGRIFRACEVLAMARGGVDDAAVRAQAQALREAYGARITCVDTVQMDIGATRIRRCIEEGRPWREWVAGPVADYIVRHGLYGAGTKGRECSSVKHRTVFDKRNVSMMMDLYELTMANGYFLQEQQGRRVAFDVFYRRNPDGGGFSIFAGLEQILEYLEGLHFADEDIEYLRGLNLFDDTFLEYLRAFRFTGDVYAFAEGTVMYPGEPIITVVADLVQAQIIETELLAQVNHQSLIATKARRIVRAAAGRPVSDFGARRAHNNDSAVYGARACCIGGVSGTATVSAGQEFDIPVGGTMAHSWVMFYKDELQAFRRFAEIYPNNCILLVDTYDVLRSGVPNAIKVFEEMRAAGIKSANYGIRLDSGDLAYLSREARAMLDEAGFTDAKIVVSNSLDEFTITSILKQGGCIDAFGVGERMITARSEPVFGAVYKLCAVSNDEGGFDPRIKISETVAKITNPGLKRVYRVYDSQGKAVADLISGQEGVSEERMRAGCPFVDPERPWKKLSFVDCTAKELQKPVMRGGVRVDDRPTVRQIAAYVREQLSNEIWDEEQRFENPHLHYIDMTPEYYAMKLALLEDKHND